MAEEQLVLFSLGKEEFAIPITQVKEIIQFKDVTKIPNTAEYIKGVINLRGQIIPVVDLAMKLQLSSSVSSDKRALIIETNRLEIGVVVDEVTEVIRLQDSAIEPLPTVSTNEYIRGIGKDGNRLLILLNVNSLFGEDEVQDLKRVG